MYSAFNTVKINHYIGLLDGQIPISNLVTLLEAIPKGQGEGITPIRDLITRPSIIEIQLDSVDLEIPLTPSTPSMPYDIYAKHLKVEEAYDAPRSRFRNHVTVYHNSSAQQALPRPIGFLYSGTEIDLMSGMAAVYVLTQFVQGKTLESVLRTNDGLTPLVDRILNELGRYLNILRSEGKYLFDLDPRHIIVRDGTPVMTKMKNVAYSDKKSSELSDKQEKSLREKFGAFFNESDLSIVIHKLVC